MHTDSYSELHHGDQDQQESLANANVSARQQCMYEGRYRRNLSSVENPTVEENAMSLLSILYAADAILPTSG